MSSESGDLLPPSLGHTERVMHGSAQVDQVTGDLTIVPGHPSIPPTSVSRDRIVRMLDLAFHQRVTIVVAPAGYGKTTLLSQWAASHLPGRVVWLSITEDHNDPFRLAVDLCRVLEVSDGTEGLSVLPHYDANTAAMGQAFVSALASAIDDSAPIAVVLDDF